MLAEVLRQPRGTRGAYSWVLLPRLALGGNQLVAVMIQESIRHGTGRQFAPVFAGQRGGNC